jgi:hypothetical protein
MLYHKDLGFPKGFNSQVGTVVLQYTQHAKLAALNDKYGRIDLQRTIDTNKAECIEIQLEQGLIIVCRPQGRGFIVPTVWLNLKSDKHETLNLSRYSVA